MYSLMRTFCRTLALLVALAMVPAVHAQSLAPGPRRDTLPPVPQPETANWGITQYPMFFAPGVRQYDGLPRVSAWMPGAGAPAVAAPSGGVGVAVPQGPGSAAPTRIAPAGQMLPGYAGYYQPPLPLLPAFGAGATLVPGSGGISPPPVPGSANAPPSPGQ